MAVDPDQATFIGFVVEAMCYGIYIPLFMLSLAFLIWRRKTKSSNRRMVFASCLLFACCTTHFSLAFSNIYEVLILNPGGAPISTETPKLLGADMLVSITDFFGELVLIYRLYMVWGQASYIAILPLLLALAGVSCAMGGLGLLAVLDPTAPTAPAALVPLGTAAFAIPLCCNALVTLLIVARIWYIGRGARNLLGASSAARSMFSSTSDHLRHATSVIVEAGGLYLVAQLLVVVLFALGHPAQPIVVAMAVQTYGIAPTLILVRVGLGISSETTMGGTSTGRLSTNVVFNKRQPAAISVTTNQTHTHDYELSYATKSVISPAKYEIESV